MRQETINIYTIDDHPNKEACFDWIRNNWHDLGEHIIEEMLESLKALASELDAKTFDYSIGITPDCGEFVSFDEYNMRPLKALYAKRDECPLTGVCYDHDVIEGLYKGDLQSAVLKVLHAEGEHLYSDEGLTEMCQGNDYEFKEDGSIH